MRESPIARRMDSIYRLAKDAPDPIYGVFPNCQILGDPCTIKVESIDDADPRVVDILGFNAFRRRGLAIHISGMDDFGRKDRPRRILGIGIQECVWSRTGHHPSGIGCAGPDPVVILDTPEPHFALWSRADAFVTLEGLFRRMHGNDSVFTAEDVAEWINYMRPPYLHLAARQVSAIRKLLEACVAITDRGIPGGGRLLRAGGRFRFRVECSKERPR